MEGPRRISVKGKRVPLMAVETDDKSCLMVARVKSCHVPPREALEVERADKADLIRC